MRNRTRGPQCCLATAAADHDRPQVAGGVFLIPHRRELGALLRLRFRASAGASKDAPSLGACSAQTAEHRTAVSGFLAHVHPGATALRARGTSSPSTGRYSPRSGAKRPRGSWSSPMARSAWLNVHQHCSGAPCARVRRSRLRRRGKADRRPSWPWWKISPASIVEETDGDVASWPAMSNVRDRVTLVGACAASASPRLLFLHHFTHLEWPMLASATCLRRVERLRRAITIIEIALAPRRQDSGERSCPRRSLRAAR